MDTTASLPVAFLVLAQTAVHSTSTEMPSGILTLANYGLAGLMLLWFVWRDKRMEERRDNEHAENKQSQKEQTRALNLMTHSMMVLVMSTRNADETIRELAQKIKSDAEKDNETLSPS